MSGNQVAETEREREIRVGQSPAFGCVEGFCNCCGREAILITDNELGESICSVCRSYDVLRKFNTRGIGRVGR